MTSRLQSHSNGELGMNGCGDIKMWRWIERWKNELRGFSTFLPITKAVFSGVIYCRRPVQLNPRRHSPFHHPSRHRGGGGDATPLRDWLLSALELRFKNQRVACHETKPLTPEFKVLGQPVTSEVRSMTQKRPKCDFADNFVSEQARATI